MRSEQAARDLGWASIGIGLAEILAPKQLENVMGIEKDAQTTGILRTLGVREIMHGVDLLSHRDPTSGVWGRVAGDVLDTALLGVVAMRTKRPASFALVAGMVMAIGIADMVVATRLTAKRSEMEG